MPSAGSHLNGNPISILYSLFKLMKGLILLFGLFCLYGCHCQYYNVNRIDSHVPVDILGTNYTTKICDEQDEEIIIGVSEEEESYEIAEDSMGYGYVGIICYSDRPDLLHIRVGAGSEFEVGKCRFRVIKVFDPWTWDTVRNPLGDEVRYLHQMLAIQLIKAPSRCGCANRSLKKYEQTGLDPKWLEKIYAERWK